MNDGGEFTKETIKVFRDVTDPSLKGQTEIAVIRWTKDGRSFAPQLANQEVYFDRLTKEKKYGKMKALKLADFKFIVTNAPEIEALLREAPPAPRPDTQKAAAADRDPFED